MSKRGNKKKNNNDDDKIWEEKEKQSEKKIQTLKKEITQNQDHEFVQQKTFEFKFDNQHQFIKKEKEIQKREAERKKLLKAIQKEEEQMRKQEEAERPEASDADLAQKEGRKVKEKIKKENKDKLKQQRKQAEKIQQTIERERKQQEQKLAQLAQAEYTKRREAQSRDGVKIIVGLLIFILVAGYLQYKGEVHQRYQSFRVSGAEDLYGILEADSGLSDNQLKQKYKKLAIKYHPDKNKDCVDCKQKFARIIKAWQILGNTEKRQSYDTNNGIITKIKSKSITLTPHNYYQQVESSNDLWIIQAYDSTSQYCHHFSQFWQQIVEHYSGVVKFGRIDVWSQDNMRSFIPYSFTIFPSIYSVRKDKTSDIYALDPRRVIDTMKQFVEKELSRQYPQTKIDNPQLIQKLQTTQRPILITGRAMNYHLKSILSKYSDYVDGYILEDRSFKLESNEIRVYTSPTDYTKYSLKTSAHYLDFSIELRRYFIQRLSLCQMITSCEDTPCALVLNSTHPFTKVKYPQISVEDSSLFEKIKLVKQKIGFNENFQFALYFNGKIEFGNQQDLDVINVEEEGELIDLECVPPFRIQYWQLLKIGVLALIMLYTTNRKILAVLGLIAAYLVYGLF